MRTSKDQYKLPDGSLIEIGGMDEIPEGATLWNGYDYKKQYWVFEGQKDTRSLEELKHAAEVPADTEDRAGLIVYVYKNKGHNQSNGGFSSACEELTLVGPGIPKIFPVTPERPAVKLVARMLGSSGRPYVHAEPDYKVLSGEVGWMAGGCFIHSSDSRFPFDYPISLHDRAESKELNEALSR